MNETVFSKDTSSDVTDMAVVVSQPLSTAIQVAYISIGTIGIFGNLLSLVVLLGHAPLRRKSANYFTTNQTFIDFLASIMLIPSLLVDADRLSGALACYVWRPRTVFLGLFTASLFNITALTVERYVKTVHPIRHRLWVTKRRLLLVVVGVSVSGVLLKMPYVLVGTSLKEDGTCVVRTFPTDKTFMIFAVYNLLVEYILPLLVIAFCYIQIARTLNSKSIRPVTSTAPNPGNLAMARASRNCIRTSLYVVLVFVACTTFKHVLVMMRSFSGVPFDATGPIFNAAQILSFAVCCTNPFIYIFHYEEFKVGLRKVVCRKQTKQAAVAGQTTNIDQGAPAGNDKF